jgi:hypothetical protein
MIDTEPLAPWEIPTVARRDTVGWHIHERILRRALAYKRRIDERARRYQEKCDYWAREGHRPHYCIHGTDLWTDYDNICQGCEDGTDPYVMALDLAWADHREMVKRADATIPFACYDPAPPIDLAPVWAWVNEPMQRDI